MIEKQRSSNSRVSEGRRSSPSTSLGSSVQQLPGHSLSQQSSASLIASAVQAPFQPQTRDETFQPRTRDEIQQTIRRWKRCVRPRARDVFVTNDMLEQVLVQLARGIDSRDDPVFGARDRHAIWHGEVTRDDSQPAIRIVKPGEAEIVSYVNRLVPFLFATDDVFAKLASLPPKDPCEMGCGDQLCVHLEHLAVVYQRSVDDTGSVGGSSQRGADDPAMQYRGRTDSGISGSDSEPPDDDAFLAHFVDSKAWAADGEDAYWERDAWNREARMADVWSSRDARIATPNRRGDAPKDRVGQEPVFAIVLRRTGETPQLGIDLDLDDPEKLVVDGVSGGCMQRWNKENPEKKVASGDRIMSVNGVFRDVDGMVEELKSSSVVEMVIKRGEEESSSDSDTSKISDRAREVWHALTSAKTYDRAEKEEKRYKAQVRRDEGDEPNEELNEWTEKMALRAQRLKLERKAEKQRKREVAEAEANAKEDLRVKEKARERRLGAKFQMIIVRARRLRKIDGTSTPNAYCKCEVVVDNVLTTTGFRTEVVQSADPDWHHRREVYCGIGGLFRLSVCSKDAWADELLGSVDLLYDKMHPGGFRGDLLLKMHGTSTKAALSVEVTLLETGVRSKADEEADILEVERMQDEIQTMERRIEIKKEQLRKLQGDSDIMSIRQCLEPPLVKSGMSGTTLPWDKPLTSPELSAEKEEGASHPRFDLATMRLRRDALRVFLEGKFGSLASAIEEITGAPVRHSEASFPRHQRETNKDVGVTYPCLSRFRSILEEMGYFAPRGELHWWPLLFAAVDVDEDDLLSPLDLYEALVLDRAPASIVTRQHNLHLANGKPRSRSQPPTSTIQDQSTSLGQHMSSSSRRSKAQPRSRSGDELAPHEKTFDSRPAKPKEASRRSRLKRARSENSTRSERSAADAVDQAGDTLAKKSSTPFRENAEAQSENNGNAEDQSENNGKSRIRVTIVSASGLRKADWRDLSDPFCSCETLPHRGDPKFEFKTDVIEDTLDPVWNQIGFVLDDNAFVSKSLKFTVWDKDELKNDLLGTAMLDRRMFFPDGFEGDMVLKSSGTAARATLKLKIEVLAATQPALEMTEAMLRDRAVPTGTLSRKVASRGTMKVRMKIIGAKGLRKADFMSESDPICVCEVIGAEGKMIKTFKTQVINSTRNPKWHYMEDLTLNVGDSFHFKVLDYDAGKQDDLLGVATLDTSQFWPGGFEGNLLLKEAGRNITATLQIDIEVLPVITKFEMPKPKMVRVRRAKSKKPSAARLWREEQEKEMRFREQQQQETLNVLNPYAYLEKRRKDKAAIVEMGRAVDAGLEDEMFNQFIRFPEDREEAKLEQHTLAKFARSGVTRRAEWNLERVKSGHTEMEYLPKPKGLNRRPSGRSDGKKFDHQLGEPLDVTEANFESHLEPFRPASHQALESVTKGMHGQLLDDVSLKRSNSMWKS